MQGHAMWTSHPIVITQHPDEMFADTQSSIVREAIIFTSLIAYSSAAMKSSSSRPSSVLEK